MGLNANGIAYAINFDLNKGLAFESESSRMTFSIRPLIRLRGVLCSVSDGKEDTREGAGGEKGKINDAKHVANKTDIFICRERVFGSSRFFSHNISALHFQLHVWDAVARAADSRRIISATRSSTETHRVRRYTNHPLQQSGR